MAFTYMTAEGDFNYNVDWAVGGSGAPSHKIDTMLVQAMMHVFYYEQGGMVVPTPWESLDRVRFDPPAGQTSIAIDGVIGPITRAHIDTFQDSLRKMGWKMKVDHRMDPFRGGEDPLSFKQRQGYSLGRLGGACKFNDSLDGTGFYLNLRWREDMPATLRAALKTEKMKADQYKASWYNVPETGGG
ncbi:MAG: peptidoglycan-binding protein [Ottowia sp.]|uniref:peptidoglycan-binding protein n=1 Tax=unclassified Ottowia TaxID=2645081 RepID=UPI003C2F3C89